MRLFPKEIDFFEIFDKTSLNITKAASRLVDLMEIFDDTEARAKEIHEIEQDSDMLTHDIMKKLNKTFITPIDREDLYSLASRMDDVIDLIWAVADRIAVFKLKEPMREAIKMSKDILTTAEVMHKAVKKLKEKNYAHVQEYCIEINRLENTVDRGFRDALGKLFDDVKDPILIIKWKEIYEHLEDASDRCEDVANILEAIVLKYA
ncbi:putative phosphate transport regulator [Candidatus Sulfobium mesophilum]|uniref:Putative phosphate transport regulator n=1 Tax=Candidatus Sulfobium mesophilum TaxID=2016548 RepID=A0A2U3QH14_9BACT|nr:putative phosphate transport regulator [Candidatus Sulfobium mesophilum]